MSTQVRTDAQADLEAICKAIVEKKPIDPAVSARVEERGKKARAELLRTHGITNIAVDLVREARDE
jgi:hypothetical protein